MKRPQTTPALLALLISFTCSTALGETGHKEPQAHPGGRSHHTPGQMNERFVHEDVDADAWAKRFEAPDRDVIAHREAILDRLPLKSGETVADIGAGTGAFLRGLSERVGAKGKVIAVDISPKFVSYMETRAKAEKLPNVSVRLGKLEATTLSANSVDFLLVVDTYHHFDHPKRMLMDFRSALRPGGRLVIVDFWKKKDSREWIRSHIRLDKPGYIQEISKEGFSLLRDEDIPMKENFMLVFSAKKAVREKAR